MIIDELSFILFNSAIVYILGSNKIFRVANVIDFKNRTHDRRKTISRNHVPLIINLNSSNRRRYRYYRDNMEHWFPRTYWRYWHCWHCIDIIVDSLGTSYQYYDDTLYRVITHNEVNTFINRTFNSLSMTIIIYLYTLALIFKGKKES